MSNEVPLELYLTISLKRLPRAPCYICLKRRVLFVLTNERGGPTGMALCAVCAGVR